LEVAGRIRRLPGLALLALLLVYPLLATPFWTVQIGAQTLFMGVIALSLMFLAGYGGMVSLAQMTVAGVAGYMSAIFGVASADLGLGWPWWLSLPLSLLIAVIFAALVGWISSRTEGIYTIMITLAIAVAFFYFARQNYAIFNGFNGFAGLEPPALFGVDWRAPLPFYYLSLGVAAFGYGLVRYLSRTTFGLGIQAIRDNPRRMRALGFDVTLHRVMAHATAGLLAALGGLLLVWFNGRISPGTVGVDPVINILVIAVLGGLLHPIGPFLGALLFVLLQNFAIDLVAPERFRLVIGGVFLLIVLCSPDGIVGLWRHHRHRLLPSRREW
jgi:branched-chain amino acid transport system permease protein